MPDPPQQHQPAAAAAAAAAAEEDKQQALKSSFRVPRSRYQIKDVLGQGAYGVVVSAVDLSSTCGKDSVVAVKKIERVFDHPTFTKRTLREIRVLRLLKHENIISLKSVFATTTTSGGGGQRFDDLYLVFDLMQTDLASIIKSPQPLSGQHVQFFLYQLLRGLKFLHSAGIIHRDIKPRNLLVNSNCDLKICDMGLARYDTSQLATPVPPPPSSSSSIHPEMTDYVATRWYRAPEIILQWPGYSKAIDLWAVGCILAELLGRRPIFPGTDADHQMQLICDVLGRPQPDLVLRCPHDETREFLLAIPAKPRRPLVSLYAKTADIPAIDLLNRLLRYDPDKRLTVNECLKHQYLSQLHCPSDEPESERLDLERDFPFDAKEAVTAAELEAFVWREIELMGELYVDEDAEEEEARRPSAVSASASSPAHFKPPPPHANSPLTSKRRPPVPPHPSSSSSKSPPQPPAVPPPPTVDAAAAAGVVRRTPKPPSTTAPPIGPRPVPKAMLAAKPPSPSSLARSSVTAAAAAAAAAAAEEFSPRVVHTPLFNCDDDDDDDEEDKNASSSNSSSNSSCSSSNAAHTPKSTGSSSKSNLSLELGALTALLGS